MQTRDGLLRAAMPEPIGTCSFVNDLGIDELVRIARRPPRAVWAIRAAGDGEDMFRHELRRPAPSAPRDR